MIKSNKKFEVIAEDYHSPFFRNYLFVKGTSDYKRLLGFEGPNMAILSRENKIEYLAQMDTWVKAHQDLKKIVLKDIAQLERLIDIANEHGQKMNSWTEKNIFNKNLRKLSNLQLIKLWEKFNVLCSKEYTYGVALPILDFQGFSLVENSIKEFLQSKVPAEKFQHYFSVFTEPQANSFSLEQEINLLKLIQKHHRSPSWRKDVKRHELETIQKKYRHFYLDLKRHAKRYAWLYYVYRGPAFTECEFLNFVKDSLNKKILPEKRLVELKEKRYKNISLKKQYLKELNPDNFNKKMLELAGKLVWAKPRRKDYQSKSYFHMEKLQREIGKRLFLGLEQIRSTPLNELERFLKSGKINNNIPNDYFQLHICVRNGNNKVSYFTSKQAENFIKQKVYAPVNKKNDNLKITEFIGQTAFGGKVRGVVKIINRIEDMDKMARGDILVSIATTPSIVPAIKKAGAIITDEGGLTCHASIISREMEIPCVVGLKTVSKVLKDGDMVEVDANKGIVRKI